MAEIDIRRVIVYALTSPPPAVEFRRAIVYALVSPLPTTYLRMKGNTALLTAINKEHGKSLTTAQVSFNDPSSIVDGNYNSSVPMVPSPDWVYSGEMVFRYNRYPLSSIFDGSKNLPAGAQTTVHERLPAINSAFSCNLEPRDIVDGPVAANATGLTLTVAATSWLFVPGTTVRLGTA